MKSIINKLIILSFLTFSLIACGEEEGEDELDIQFKTAEGYVHSNETLAGGTEVKIGIEAETEKAKDPIIKFNISESVDGGANATVYSEDLDDTDYEYDYVFTLGTESGSTHKYTFTIVNKDGLSAQTSLTLTVQ